MAEFQTDVDIANSALQLCGQSRINPTLGFADTGKGARETKFAYGKLRRAELEENAWRFAIKNAMLRAIDISTMLLAPALWSAVTTYFVNSIVADQYGNLWISNTRNNLNNDPLATLAWEPYFGPLTVALWAAGSYSAGELVYTTPGDGTYRVYLSLIDANTDNPATATAYSAATVYMKNQVVTSSAVAYMSLIDFNTANTPALSPPAWAIGTTYGAAAAVMGSDGVKYASIAGGNLGNDPTLGGGFWTNTGVLVPWTTVFTAGTGSDQWLQIGGAEAPGGVALTVLGVKYSPGTGPSSQASSRNVYRLPNNYLCLAPQNPKATTSWLGGPSGVAYNDWNFAGDYLITAESGPLPLRFVADITDVRRMSDLFCWTLAYRIALTVCDSLTQSASQLANIQKAYSVFSNTAKTRNAIEMGYDTPPDDDYVTVRY